MIINEKLLIFLIKNKFLMYVKLIQSEVHGEISLSIGEKWSKGKVSFEFCNVKEK